MAHNFKLLTGTRYVSKAGNDANAGTPDAPKKTIGALTAGLGAGSFYIGTGQYTDELLTNANASSDGLKLYADGKVVLRGTGVFATNSGYRPVHVTDLIFENFSSSLTLQIPTVTRCFFRDTAVTTWGFYTDTIFINSIFNRRTGDTNLINMANCIFIGGRVEVFFGATSFTVNKCYFSSTTPLSTDRPTLISNSNIRGTVMVNGVLYNTLADAKAVDSTWFPGCINADPRFVDEATENFTLRVDSPHLATGIGPTHLRLGRGYYLKGGEGPVTNNSHYLEDVVSGLQFPIYQAENIVATLQMGQLRLKVAEVVGGQLTGKIKVAIKTSDVPLQLGMNNFISGLNFNTDYPAAENLFNPNNPEVFNNNVPNAFNWSSGHAGRNPNRLDYAMRWSTKDNPNLTQNSDWITGAQYLIFEWGMVPTYNPISFRGNADPAFLPTPGDTADNPIPVVTTWMDMEIILMNNYYSK